MHLSLTSAIAERIERMRAERVVERIWAGDHTVWSDDPTELSDRLGWLRIHQRTLSEAPDIQQFARLAVAEGFEPVVLMGMGGSSLAPEVFANSIDVDGPQLHVLDSTDPRQIAALEEQIALERTLFVVSSKSGGTIETRSQMEYFWSKTPQGRQFVAVTDPGSELDRIGEGRGFRRVFLNAPDIGGRYSALSYFGIVPAALCGIGMETILGPADGMAAACGPEMPLAENPGVELGVFMGEAALAGRDKLTLVLPPEIESLGHWIEQLVAESTGKHSRGILPIEAEKLAPPEMYGDDRVFVASTDNPALGAIEAAGHPVLRLPPATPETLGAEMFRWMFATAVAGYIMKMNPFDQPNVQEAKEATSNVLAGRPVVATTPALADVLSSVQSGDYIAILAYLPRSQETGGRLQVARHVLRDRFRVATSIGFGPRYLHSTGQFHKGGPNSGVFIQVIDPASEDIEIPGAPYTFGQLQGAQALGDLAALKHHGRRVARVSMDELEHFARMARD